MKFFTWMSGLLISCALLTGVVLLSYAQSLMPEEKIRYEDGGATLLFAALIAIIITALVYRGTNSGVKPVKTPVRLEMHIIFNLAAFSLLVGNALTRHIDYIRVQSPQPWASAVGVPTFDSFYGYLIFVIPANYFVYQLLKGYRPETKVYDFSKTIRNNIKTQNPWLTVYSIMFVIASVALVASLAVSDFARVPAAMWNWLFFFLLLAGTKPLRRHKS